MDSLISEREVKAYEQTNNCERIAMCFSTYSILSGCWIEYSGTGDIKICI